MQPESDKPSSKSTDRNIRVFDIAPDPVKKDASPVKIKSSEQVEKLEPFGPDNLLLKAEKSSKLYMFVLVIFLILLAGLTYYFKIYRNKQVANINKSSPVASYEVKAVSLVDFAAVCNGKGVANAPDLKNSPHPIVLLEEAGTVKGSYSVSTFNLSDQTWQASDNTTLATQLVGCITKISEVDSGRKCTFTSQDRKTITLPLYSVIYQLNVYEAQRGNRLGAKQLNGPAARCPTFDSYNQSDPKIYGEVNINELNEAVREYVTK